MISNSLTISKDKNNLALIKKYILVYTYSIGLVNLINFLILFKYSTTKVDNTIK